MKHMKRMHDTTRETLYAYERGIERGLDMASAMLEAVMDGKRTPENEGKTDMQLLFESLMMPGKHG